MEVDIYITREDLTEERRKKYHEVIGKDNDGYFFEEEGKPHEIFFSDDGELNISFYFGKGSSIHVYIPIEELIRSAKMEDLKKILEEKKEEIEKTLKALNEIKKITEEIKQQFKKIGVRVC